MRFFPLSIAHLSFVNLIIDYCFSMRFSRNHVIFFSNRVMNAFEQIKSSLPHYLVGHKTFILEKRRVLTHARMPEFLN